MPLVFKHSIFKSANYFILFNGSDSSRPAITTYRINSQRLSVITYKFHCNLFYSGFIPVHSPGSR